MAFDPVIKNPEELPENLHGLKDHLVQRKDGAWVLELANNGRGNPNVDRMEQTVKAIRGEKEKLERLIEDHKDLIEAADEAREALKKRGEMANWDGDKLAQERAKAMIEAEQAKFRKELEKVAKRENAQRDQLKKLIQDKAVEKMLDGMASIKKTARKLAKDQIEKRVHVKETTDAQGVLTWVTELLDSDGNVDQIHPVTPEQIQHELQQTFPILFEATSDQGVGVEPGSSAAGGPAVIRRVRRTDIEGINRYSDEISKGTVQVID